MPPSIDADRHTKFNLECYTSRKRSKRKSEGSFQELGVRPPSADQVCRWVCRRGASDRLRRLRNGLHALDETVDGDDRMTFRPPCPHMYDDAEGGGHEAQRKGVHRRNERGAYRRGRLRPAPASQKGD